MPRKDKKRKRVPTRPTAVERPAAVEAPSGSWWRFAAPAAVISLVFGLAAAGFSPIDDNDVGFHIRLGATIWDAKSAPDVDRHSFTADGAAYLDHEWLPQVLLCVLDRALGVTGLVALKGLLLLVAFGLVAAALPARWSTRVAVLVFCAVVAHSRIQMRPHLMAWVLIGALLLLQRRRAFVAVIPLLALWANCHASFLLAVLMSLVWAAESYVRDRSRKTLVFAALFAAAPCLNPYGPEIYLFAAQIRGHVGFVSEWQRYPLASGYLWVLVAYLVLLGIDVARRREGRLFDGLRLLLLGGLALTAMRNGIEAMLYLAPIAAARLEPLLERRSVAVRGLVAAAVAAVGLSGGVYLLASDKAFRFEIDRYALPLAAADFVSRARLEGNMFNDYDFGGYFLWKLYPARRVFVDGRIEVYSRGRALDDYLTVSKADPGWQAVVRRYDIAFFAVRADRPIARALSESAAFELVYFDYNSAVFVKRGAAPHLKRLRLLTPWGNRDRARVDESIAEARYLLSQNDGFFGGYKILAFLLARRGDFAGARDALRRYLALRPEGRSLAETETLIDELTRRAMWP